ncbi:MAG: hypothetical protein ABI792_06950, partial [bacterium]
LYFAYCAKDQRNNDNANIDQEISTHICYLFNFTFIPKRSKRDIRVRLKCLIFNGLFQLSHYKLILLII